MAEYLIQDTTLTAIADAIRAKTNTTNPVTTSDMANLINSISVNTELKDGKLYLYKAGDQCVSVTGGWEKKSYGNNSGNPVATFGTDSITLTSSTSATSVVIGCKDFDSSILKNFKTMYVKCTSYSGVTGRIGIAYDYSISDLAIGSDIKANASYASMGTHSLDISTVDDGYPVLSAWHATVVITEIWLE